MRRLLPVFVMTALFAGCSGGASTETPLTLPERTSQATPPADPAVVPQDDVVVPTAPPIGTGDGGLLSGPAQIGPDCAAYLAPARALLVLARSGTELTAAQATSLQDRINGALDVCTPDEYVSFQSEMFPPNDALTDTTP